MKYSVSNDQAAWCHEDAAERQLADKFLAGMRFLVNPQTKEEDHELERSSCRSLMRMVINGEEQRVLG